MKKTIILLVLTGISLLSHSAETNINKKNEAEFLNTLYSIEQLKELKYSIIESKYLTINWVFIEKLPKTPNKLKLENITNNNYQPQIKTINNLSKKWSPIQLEKYSLTKEQISELTENQKYIMGYLQSFDSYDDLLVLFEVTPMVEEGGSVIEITNSITANIDILISTFESKLTKFIPPLEKPDISVDLKMIFTKLFIEKFGLNSLANSDDKIKIIYDYYSQEELMYALETPDKDESFYQKYNELVKLLNK